ncbi:MAG: YihY/virulence factor BrkB family protein [Blautia sp.]|nr:YihY/virulence factor BrkB family protein [Blautia sp.]
MNEKKNKNIFKVFLGLIERASHDHVGAYAAQAAYFLILSFIPFLIFLMTILRYTPISYNMVRHAIMGVVPENLHSFVLGIVAEVYGKSSAALPIAAVTSLWSAGKGMHSLTNGLNTIYHVKETRGWFFTRIHCIGWTILFVLALVASLFFVVLGNQLNAQISKYIPFLGKRISRIMPARSYLVFAALFFIFLVLFKALPNRKAAFRSQIPGAFLTAVAWSAFSYLFSLYFGRFPGFTNMYGSLAAIIAIMLWLDISMILVLYGAEINAYFEKEILEARKSVRHLIHHEKKETEKMLSRVRRHSKEAMPARQDEETEDETEDETDTPDA